MTTKYISWPVMAAQHPEIPREPDAPPPRSALLAICFKELSDEYNHEQWKRFLAEPRPKRTKKALRKDQP